MSAGTERQPAAKRGKQALTGYSGTPVWKKLGYKAGVAAYVDSSPPGYRSELALPRDIPITWLSQPTLNLRFVHLFARQASNLNTKLKSYRATMAPDAVLWVSWPKKSSGVKTDISEDMIREMALPLGLVDIKVCAFNETWSGLKLMIRKQLR